MDRGARQAPVHGVAKSQTEQSDWAQRSSDHTRSGLEIGEKHYRFMHIFLWLSECEVKVAQTCPTLCNAMDYTVRGIPQARWSG